MIKTEKLEGAAGEGIFLFYFYCLKLLQVTCNFPRLSQLQIFEDYTKTHRVRKR